MASELVFTCDICGQRIQAGKTNRAELKITTYTHNSSAKIIKNFDLCMSCLFNLTKPLVKE